MSDYKAMYLTMIRATEEAINILIEAQRKAEELYIDSPAPTLRLLPQEEHIGEEEI